MRALPGDYEGEADSWEHVMTWLHRLAEAQRTVQVHFGTEQGDALYFRLEGRFHHAHTAPDRQEWFVVGDTAPDPGDIGGPWNYIRLPRGRYLGARIETIDDDDLFGIVIDFGEQIVVISQAL